MLSPQEQLTVLNEALVKFKTDLIGKEIEMRLLPQGSLKQRFLQDHIQAIRKEIAQLEHGSSEKSATSVKKERLFPVALSDFPALTLQYLRLRRQLEVKQEVFKLLTGQLETAKIEEVRERSRFQVLDPAIPPRYPEKPKKKIIVGLAGILGLFGGIFLAFLLEGVKKEKQRLKDRS